MREHILSSNSEKRMIPKMQEMQYSFEKQASLSTLNMGGNTLITKATEISDPDEFYLWEGTLMTEAREVSDPDEFLFSSREGSCETRQIEVSDADKFRL